MLMWIGMILSLERESETTMAISDSDAEFPYDKELDEASKEPKAMNAYPDHDAPARRRIERRDAWASPVEMSDMSQDDLNAENVGSDADDEFHSLLKTEESPMRRGRESRE